MTTRKRKSTVTFLRPFRLAGMEEEQPAGDYRVETDEELLEGMSFAAYRRVKVLVHLHKRPERPNVTESVWIEPVDLDAALERDTA